ncbi:MAG: HAMP domain-containing sensor histidine kinase [Desulfobulbaceae bacterium]|jgi:signal transduction histidine kinase|nr:HAMP domain-containing sensor histidine kinase [Desulfobulbaceae bacterium]
MTDKEKLEAWEQAYLGLYKEAHIGRVFKGTVHNLNGVIQAGSMQIELLELMFPKVRKLLTPVLQEPLSTSAIESLQTVLKLVEKREKMLAPMTDKIAYSQELIKNTENICYRPLNADSLTLQILLQNVIGFYQSDMFFKHKVKVSFELQSDFKIDSLCADLALVFQNIIQNSISALILKETKEPAITIFGVETDSTISVHIVDNGIGVAAAIRDQIFEPFVSGWDSSPGLGLYFCRQICDSLSCSINFESLENGTDFIVTIPKL